MKPNYTQRLTVLLMLILLSAIVVAGGQQMMAQSSGGPSLQHAEAGLYPLLGSFTLSGNPSGVSLAQTNGMPADLAAAATVLTNYPVNFTEVGLPPNTSWEITVNENIINITSDSTILQEANGSYAFTVLSIPGYTATPSSGTINITGTPVEETITFTPVLYAVVFSETGLVSGGNWSVTINGNTIYSDNATISINEANGAYNYTISSVNKNFVPTPSKGSVTVDQAGASVDVAFAYSNPIELYIGLGLVAVIVGGTAAFMIRRTENVKEMGRSMMTILSYSKKSTKKEYNLYLKLVILALALTGGIGFIIHLVAALLGGA